MCTLTYVPRPSESIITVNRDEAPSRAASAPIIRQKDGRRFWLAPEPISGSSNTILDIINQRLAVLLNGAFVAHEHNPPYRKSRGDVIQESFEYANLYSMKLSYQFDGIEPFTLLNFQNNRWEEMRWDGREVYMAEPDISANHIWSSAKLYAPEAAAKREKLFFDFVDNSRAIYPQQLFDIHRRNQNDPRGLGFRMNFEDRVKTVSVTQLVFANGRITLRYLDLMAEPITILERSF